MTPDPIHFDSLLPLMRARGVTISPAQFHHIVNVTFHKFESGHYDSFHQEMWDDLPAQFDLLAKDLVDQCGPLSDKLNVLDIGCGTGLSSQLLLGTPIGKHVAHIDLIDTSPEMLARCSERAAMWGVDHSLVEGTIDQALGDGYDLILACSVLHHIPDLSGFIQRVRGLQAPGGFFMHVQDPNGDYLDDPDLLRRSEELKQASKRRVPWWRRALLPLRVARRVYRAVTGSNPAPPKDYIFEFNEALLADGIIKSPLTDAEIWSVTDIHENNLPFSTGTGISLRSLAAMLPNHEMITARSYSFFGRMMSKLPPAMRAEEIRLINEHAMNGRHVAAVWRSKV